MKAQTLPTPALPGLHQNFWRLGVILAYVAIFSVAVPWLLWSLGSKLDLALRLPPVDQLRAPGMMLTAAGAVVWVWSQIWLITVGRGLPISSLPPTRLVASGPYAWVGHPIYLGFTMIVAGLGCSVGSLGHGLAAPAILALCCWTYVTSFEEPALQRRFGESYPQVGRASRLAHLRAIGWSRLRAPAEWLANRPVLLRVGPTIWVTYGFFVALGVFLATLLGRSAVGSLFSGQQYVAYCAGIAFFPPLGARTAALLYNFAALRCRALAELRTVGFVSWGGYAGLIGFTAVFGLANHIPPLAILDQLCPVLFLAMAVGRLGCVTYGCCKGLPAPAGMRWTHPDSKLVRLLGPNFGSQPRAPVQLISAAACLACAGLSLALNLRSTALGATTALGTLCYALTRLGIEQRRDEPRFAAVRWTRGQWFALATAVLALLLALTLDPGLSVAVSHPPPDWLALGVSSLVGAFILVVYGLHWRRIGRW